MVLPQVKDLMRPSGSEESHTVSICVSIQWVSRGEKKKQNYNLSLRIKITLVRKSLKTVEKLKIN